MARILLIANLHADEAFSISVAMELAKTLRKAGQDAVFRPIRSRDTALGKILHEKSGKIFSAEELMNVENRLTLLQKSKSLARECGANLAYLFHATPNDWDTWKGRRSSYLDFDMARGAKNLWVVEVKACFKPLPERIRKRIEERTTPEARRMFSDYLTIVSSQKLTRKAGLAPEKFAERLAKEILAHAKALPGEVGYGAVRGRVPRLKGSSIRSRARKRK